VSRFLTAQQHNLGHLVPLRLKPTKRESNRKTMLQRSTRIQRLAKSPNHGSITYLLTTVCVPYTEFMTYQ